MSKVLFRNSAVDKKKKSSFLISGVYVSIWKITIQQTRKLF